MTGAQVAGKVHASRGGAEAKRASCGRQRSRVALCFPEEFHAAPVMRCRLTMKGEVGRGNGGLGQKQAGCFEGRYRQQARLAQVAEIMGEAAFTQSTRLRMTRRRAEKDAAKLADRCLASKSCPRGPPGI
jgi:hypothetical protein